MAIGSLVADLGKKLIILLDNTPKNSSSRKLWIKYLSELARKYDNTISLLSPYHSKYNKIERKYIIREEGIEKWSLDISLHKIKKYYKKGIRILRKSLKFLFFTCLCR